MNGTRRFPLTRALWQNGATTKAGRTELPTPLPGPDPRIGRAPVNHAASSTPGRYRTGWRAFDLTPDDVAPLMDRFHSRYQRVGSGDCWLWLGYTDPAGYGIIRRSRKHRQPNLLVHRVAWVAASGESLTQNMTIDHLCFTRNCVNPAHLEPVTMEENARRAAVARPSRRRMQGDAP